MGIFDIFKKKISSQVKTPVDQEWKNNPCSSDNSQFAALRLLEIAQDSTDLINNTKNPEVFFTRLNLLIDTLKKLVATEKYVKYDSCPHEDLAKLESEKECIINEFTNRYYLKLSEEIEKLSTKKAKEKRLTDFINTFNEFQSSFSKNNMIHYQEKTKEMKRLLEAPISVSKQKLVLQENQLPNIECNLSEKITNTKDFWNIMISFGKSASQNYPKALYLAEKNSSYTKGKIDGSIVHTATYNNSREDFINFINLYEIVSSWKSTTFFIKGDLVDKKTVGKIKYCYGDKCRSVKSNFCYGASYMTANPFGCHRLQVSAGNNPWWQYYEVEGSHYKFNREKLMERVHLANEIFKFCPDFNFNEVLKAVNEIPIILKKKEYEKLVSELGYSYTLNL